MSSDPKRLLDPGGDATDAERDLLRNAADVEPAPDARAATWASLATRLPPTGGAPSGTGGLGATTTGSSVGVKAAGVALAVSVLVIGTVMTMRSQRAPSPLVPAASSSSLVTAPAPSEAPSGGHAVEVTTAPSSASSAAEPLLEAPSAADAVDPPRPHAPRAAVSTAQRSAGAAMSSVDALRDESALVATARTAMRQGDGAAALAALETARTRYPRGALLQEREVLTIEALAQAGDAKGASRRAASFLKAFPTSPHAAHVRTFVP